MVGNENSGRNRLYNNPINKHFKIEREDYQKLEEIMKNEGFKEFSSYMLYIINQHYNLLELKKIFELGKIEVYDERLTNEEREVLNEI